MIQSCMFLVTFLVAFVVNKFVPVNKQLSALVIIIAFRFVEVSKINFSAVNFVN